MSRKDRFESLETLIDERRKKRLAFLAQFHSRILRAAHRQWFDYETQIVEKEIELFESVLPKVRSEWKNQLDAIKTRFKQALLALQEVAKKAEEEHIILDISASVIEIWRAASDLEKLATEVESERTRIIAS
jgi:hypothetical protein